MSIKNNNSDRTRGLFGRFVRESDGAVMVYVSIIIVVLFGFAGLAVDFGRFYTTNTQAQSAADAAAMAGATQLDGGDTAIIRATLAAQTSPLVSNVHTYATNTGAVKIVRIRFLHTLPDTDDDPIDEVHLTTDPASAAYIEVLTELLNQENYFLAAVGANSGQTNAVAVAGYTKSYCEMPPLMICNPWEEPDGGGMSPDQIDALMTGVTLLAKTKEGGVDAWDSGVMGLLQPPPYYDEATGEWDTSTLKGAKQVALALARVPQDFCYPDRPLSIQTGQVDSMRGAINTFFDIYENPFFGGGDVRNNPDFRPALNVTKGYITEWTTTDVLDADGNVIGTKTTCDSVKVDDPAIAMGLPPDTCFGPDFSNYSNCATTVGPPGSESRIGDGAWNFSNTDPANPGYWEVNHPSSLNHPFPVAPAGGWLSGKSYPSRYEVYRWEIDKNIIPNNSATGANLGGEDGNPVCYSGGGPLDGAPDRRVLSVAFIPCIALGIAGNSVKDLDHPDMFMAELFTIRPVAGGSDTNIWLEYIGRPANGDNGVRDIVQLFR